MFTKISSLTLAILLFVVLLGSRSNLYILAAAVLILIFATFALNLKRLNFTWPHLLLPTTYILGVTAVFVVISSHTIQIEFLILASTMFYFLEVKLGHESHFLQNIYLLTVFALYLGMFAVQFYFHLSTFWILPTAFFLTYMFVIQGFAGFSLPTKKYFYFLIALICTEAVLGLTLWPTHFLVDAVVLFSLFYLMWIFSFSAFFGKLSKQKIYWQTALLVIVLILTLTTAAWRPLR